MQRSFHGGYLNKRLRTCAEDTCEYPPDSRRSIGRNGFQIDRRERRECDACIASPCLALIRTPAQGSRCIPAKPVRAHLVLPSVVLECRRSNVIDRATTITSFELRTQSPCASFWLEERQ